MGHWPNFVLSLNMHHQKSIIMKAAIHPNHTLTTTFSRADRVATIGFWQRLMAYCNTQEERRFFWAGFSLLGHGTLFTIATMAAVVLTNIAFPLVVITCFNMMMVLVVNLAALPMRYVIPIFLASLAIDLLVIAAAVAGWLA
jgi:hypothetical protein